jgi:hypothetical protein
MVYFSRLDYDCRAEIITYRQGKAYISCDGFRSIKSRSIALAIIEADKMPQDNFWLSLFCTYDMHDCQFDEIDELCTDCTQTICDPEIQAKILYMRPCSVDFGNRMLVQMGVDTSSAIDCVFYVCAVGISNFDNERELEIYKRLIDDTVDERLGIGDEIYKFRRTVQEYVAEYAHNVPY